MCHYAIILPVVVMLSHHRPCPLVPSPLFSLHYAIATVLVLTSLHIRVIAIIAMSPSPSPSPLSSFRHANALTLVFMSSRPHPRAIAPLPLLSSPHCRPRSHAHALHLVLMPLRHCRRLRHHTNTPQVAVAVAIAIILVLTPKDLVDVTGNECHPDKPAEPPDKPGTRARLGCGKQRPEVESSESRPSEGAQRPCDDDTECCPERPDELPDRPKIEIADHARTTWEHRTSKCRHGVEQRGCRECQDVEDKGESTKTRRNGSIEGEKAPRLSIQPEWDVFISPAHSWRRETR